MSRIEYVDRKDTSCVKWDNMLPDFGEEGLLPLWVADMDFRVSQDIIEAMTNYVQQGVFGYYKITERYYQAYINWNAQMHGCKIKQDWMRFSPGTVSAFYWIINFMSGEGDAVMINPPVYHPFTAAIEDNKRTLVESPLVNRNGVYRIDFEDFEVKISENQVKLFILCFPHNPVGRVWSKKELNQMLEICKRHAVYVIADEVHQDLTFKRFTPVLSYNEYHDILFSLTAPSKTFNLAALQHAVVTIPDERLRNKWDQFISKIQVNAGNALGYIAAAAAYQHGGSWLEAVKEIIEENYRYLRKTLTEALPLIEISPLEGTYLAWIDFSAYVVPGQIKTLIQDKCKIAVNYGEWFGGEPYRDYVRVNLATSKENIIECTARILEAVGEV